MELIILVFITIIIGSNIIQGITGFAGTLIAMPFLILILDIETAKQVLNFTGLIASIIIAYQHKEAINKEEFLKIIGIMLIGIVIGLIFYQSIPQTLLINIFAIMVLLVALRGFILQFKKTEPKPSRVIVGYIQLLLAGVMHGMFISGGPMLVAYLSNKDLEKQSLRATLSSVWVVLNGMILIQSIINGNTATKQFMYMGLAIIPLLIGVLIGGKLVQKMSKTLFMYITYILLLLSSLSLLI